MKMTIKNAYQLAYEAYEKGDWLNAERTCNQILAANPDHYETRILFGTIKLQRRHSGKARAHLQKMHEDYPDNINVLCLLADAEQQLKQYEAAREHYKRVIEAEPNHGDAQYMYLSMLESLNRLDEAEEHINTLYDDPSFTYMHAIIKRRQKKYKEALKLLDSISNDIPEALKIRIGFERAKSLDKLGDYDDAYDSVKTAHQKIIAIRGQEGKAMFLEELKLFDRIFNTPKNKSPVKKQPAEVHFLVGFPRSGTTLLTQMLDAHPKIEVMDEFPFLRRTYVHALRMLDGRPANMNEDLDADKVKELHDVYMTSLRAYVREYTDDDDVSSDKVYIDKMPLSMVLTGFAHKLFPNAKFILSLRHPCDCALSNFMQHYEGNAAMEYMRDLGDIAEVYNKCFDLFFATTKTLKQDVHQVRYEDLIEDFEKETKAICKFLGLKYDDSISSYRDRVLTQKGVSTPSYQQITEPLYDTSKHRWLNYKKHFVPHLDDFKSYIDKFGYKTE